jgi:hypothetical protein
MNVLRTLLFATAAAFVLGVAPAAPATTANVVPNPGFEQGGCGGQHVGRLRLEAHGQLERYMRGCRRVHVHRHVPGHPNPQLGERQLVLLLEY